MKKFIMMLFAFMFMLANQALAAPANFLDSLPTTLIPDGFWSFIALLFTAAATCWGIYKSLGLMKKA